MAEHFDEEEIIPEGKKKCKKTKSGFGCGKIKTTDQFYASGNQCKKCKKDASNANYVAKTAKLLAVTELEQTLKEKDDLIRAIDDEKHIPTLTEINLISHDVDHIQLQLDEARDIKSNYLSQLRSKDEELLQIKQEVERLNLERQEYIADSLKEESLIVTQLRQKLDEVTKANKELTKTNKTLTSNIRAMETRIGELSLQLEDLK